MRLALVTPRFAAADPFPAERLASELAERAPGRWVTTVLTTTADGSSAAGFSEGERQEGRARVRRFACDDAGEASGAEPRDADRLASAALLTHLTEHRDDFDLIALFGCRPALCRAAARIAPERTVLLPFADGEEADDPELRDAFEHPAAFLFASEAEEVRVLKRHEVHRRMRETVGGALLLPRSAAPAEFRQRAGLTGHYLILTGPPEPGRGIEEFFRFFATFKERHPAALLDLVLFGPSSIRTPDRPDVRVFDAAGAADRLDAVSGALIAVTPERLATFASAAAEPFSLGTPILVNASAAQLVSDCRESNGGLYYQNYDELELILELGLRDPSLFGRLGAAGREFLAARSDWDVVMRGYDRAFRSFARPERGSRRAAGEGPSAAGPRDAEAASPAKAASDSGDPTRPADAAGPPAVEEESQAQGDEPPAEVKPEAVSGSDALSSAESKPAEDPDSSLPSFFQGSIRD